MVKRRKGKRKTVRRAKGRSAKRGDLAKAANRRALWKAFRDLKKRADKAWKKFHSDVKSCAKSDVLVKDQNHLLLLLGECNYMARECMRLAAKGRKKHRR